MEGRVNRDRYTEEDFVLDDAFCRWVLQPDATSDAFWTDWFTRHPQQREAAKEARRLILLLTRSEGQPSAMSQGEKEAAFRRFLTKSIKNPATR